MRTSPIRSVAVHTSDTALQTIKRLNKLPIMFILCALILFTYSLNYLLVFSFLCSRNRRRMNDQCTVVVISSSNSICGLSSASLPRDGLSVYCSSQTCFGWGGVWFYGRLRWRFCVMYFVVGDRPPGFVCWPTPNEVQKTGSGVHYMWRTHTTMFCDCKSLLLRSGADFMSLHILFVFFLFLFWRPL